MDDKITTGDKTIITETTPAQDFTQEADRAPAMIPFTQIDEGKLIVDRVKNSSNELFCSFNAESPEDKVRLYNATIDGTTLKSALNKVFGVKDVVIVPVDIADEMGTVNKVPRTTLLLEDGSFLSASSWGVYNSITRIASIFGGLHFDPPLKMTVVEVKTKNGFTMNLKLV